MSDGFLGLVKQSGRRGRRRKREKKGGTEGRSEREVKFHKHSDTNLRA